MQVWNIRIDLEKESLDLSRFRKEFIEYAVELYRYVVMNDHFLHRSLFLFKE
ncbi:MAG: hypothetical protein AB1567_00055 [bacterium]